MLQFSINDDPCRVRRSENLKFLSSFNMPADSMDIRKRSESQVYSDPMLSNKEINFAVAPTLSSSFLASHEEQTVMGEVEVTERASNAMQDGPTQGCGQGESYPVTLVCCGRVGFLH